MTSPRPDCYPIYCEPGIPCPRHLEETRIPMLPSAVHGTCQDCGGPLTQAFTTTANYVRCRRCGHVFPVDPRGVWS